MKNSLVAAGCTIKGTVENSIIFRSCEIEEGAVIKNSIILQHGVIGKDVSLNRMILDKNVTIKDGVHVDGSAESPIVIGKNKKI